MDARWLFSLAALSMALGAASSLRAQHVNSADAPCRAPGTGVELATCLNLAARTADAELNGAYRRIMGVLATSDRRKLQGAERTWLLYRDQTCAAERDLYEGGTGGLAAYPACLEALTRHRIGDLKTTYWWKVEKFGG